MPRPQRTPVELVALLTMEQRFHLGAMVGGMVGAGFSLEEVQALIADLFPRAEEILAETPEGTKRES